MARTVEPPDPARDRQHDIARPHRAQRDFSRREAQRYFRVKETWKWAWVAYAVFLLAALIIGSIAYTTYIFSKYRGEILPGTHVAQIDVSYMSPAQARKVITNRLVEISFVPIELRYPGIQPWAPNQGALDLHYHLDETVNAAMGVGRKESFVEQLVDRLPWHPVHTVALQYDYNRKGLVAYINQRINVSKVNKASLNAALRMDKAHVLLIPSQPGHRVDVGATVRVVQETLGSLSREVRTLPVVNLPAVITDAYARTIQSRVEAFLTQPPVLSAGKRVIVTRREDIAAMIGFHDQVSPHRGTIVMDVNPDAVARYVSGLASQIDRDPANARMTFAGGKVTVISKRHTGRTLDQQSANGALLAAVKSLKRRARIHLKVAVVEPSIDRSNPASLGINTQLGTGVTTFRGAGEARLNDITAIANTLTGVLITPGQEISLNTLVGTTWPDRVYDDRETDNGGQPVPSDGGAMQQVATTFLRAFFAAGLTVEERHPHPYVLPWYSNPVGLDAIVSPSNSEDLRFKNDTGKYLLIQTRIEPIRQELYIYVYGAKLGWQISLDKIGKVTKTYPHGPTILRQDASLAPGATRQSAWAHDGEDTVVQRTITHPNGTVTVTEIKTHYQPWQAIILEGKGSAPTAIPSPTATTTTHTATPRVTPSPTPLASPTVTSTPTP